MASKPRKIKVILREKIEPKRISEIVEEELSNLEEGFFDRVMARTKGNIAGLKTLGQNIAKVAGPVTRGGDASGLESPGMQRQMKMAQDRIGKHKDRFIKLSFDFANDMESLFGEDMARAPQSINQKYKEFGTNFEKFMADLLNLAKQVGDPNVWKQISQAQEPEKAQEPTREPEKKTEPKKPSSGPGSSPIGLAPSKKKSSTGPGSSPIGLAPSVPKKNKNKNPIGLGE